MKFRILEYYCTFNFNHKNLLIWADNFKLSEDWPVLEIKGPRHVLLSYCGKKPFNKPNEKSFLSIYHKSRWICLNKDKTGSVIKCTSDKIEIKGLNISNFESKPHVICCSFDFDLEIMLLLLMKKENSQLFHNKLFIEGIYIEIYTSFLKSKTDNIDLFTEICTELQDEYKMLEPIIYNLYKKLNLNLEYTSYNSIDPIVWHKAKRENQTEWPSISNAKIDENSIEFPTNSGVWYTGKFVGLAARHDDCPIEYIPKLYKTDHKNNPKTILYKYINNLPIEKKQQIPYTLTTKYKNKNKHKTKAFDLCMEVDYMDRVVQTSNKPLFVSYLGQILGSCKVKFESPNIKEISYQTLDKYNQRDLICLNNQKIITSKGYRLTGIPCLPWYYKQIIHDYNKLGRLDYGPVQDLMHIGIIDPNGKDRITFPYEKDKKLYKSQTLETHRLCTFKYQINVEITYVIKT